MSCGMSVRVVSCAEAHQSLRTKKQIGLKASKGEWVMFPRIGDYYAQGWFGEFVKGNTRATSSSSSSGLLSWNFVDRGMGYLYNMLPPVPPGETVYHQGVMSCANCVIPPGSFAVKRNALIRFRNFPKAKPTNVNTMDDEDEGEATMVMLKQIVPHSLLDREAVFDLKTESSIMHFSNGGRMMGDKVVITPYTSMILVNVIVEIDAATISSKKFQLMTFFLCWLQQTVGNWKIFVIVSNPAELRAALLFDIEDNRIEFVSNLNVSDLNSYWVTKVSPEFYFAPVFVESLAAATFTRVKRPSVLISGVILRENQYRYHFPHVDNDHAGDALLDAVSAGKAIVLVALRYQMLIPGLSWTSFLQHVLSSAMQDRVYAELNHANPICVKN